MASVSSGLRAVVLGMVVNLGLAVVKIVTGAVGHSYALIADGIESTTDVISSLIVFGGLRVAALPPDKAHPYGHGKAESLAGVLAALGLLVAAGIIAWHSVHQITVEHPSPAWFTLPILIVVVITKMILSYFVQRVGSELESTALRVDAWHHRADAITSASVMVGILVAAGRRQRLRKRPTTGPLCWRVASSAGTASGCCKPRCMTSWTPPLPRKRSWRFADWPRTSKAWRPSKNCASARAAWVCTWTFTCRSMAT